MSKERIANSLSLPKDIVLGVAVVTITGTYEAYIQNFRGIIEYNSTFVKLQTKSGKIKISGSNLVIEYFTNDDLLIRGTIMEVCFDTC